MTDDISGDDLMQASGTSGQQPADRVTSAVLIVQRFVTRLMFTPSGCIADRRLENLQYKCACTFHLQRAKADAAGSKVCDRVLVKYNYPTRNHEVAVRLFIELAQQMGGMNHTVVPFVKVCRVERQPFDSVLRAAAKVAAEAAPAQALQQKQQQQLVDSIAKQMKDQMRVKTVGGSSNCEQPASGLPSENMRHHDRKGGK